MFAFHSEWEPAPRSTPPDTTLLGIGDVWINFRRSAKD